MKRDIRELLQAPIDLERRMPQGWVMQHFPDLPFNTQKLLIESQNTGRKYKPVDVRKYPGLAESGVQIDPHRQKVCPVCYMVLQRSSLKKYFGNQCPKCGCRLQF